MQCISIQISPKHARDFDRTAFLERVRPIRSPEVDAIEEKGSDTSASSNEITIKQRANRCGD